MKKSSTIKCTKIHNALGNLAVNWLWGTMHGQKWYCLNSACMQFLFIHWNQSAEILVLRSKPIDINTNVIYTSLAQQSNNTARSKHSC